MKQPMFRLSLFRIRAFSAGNAASFLASLSRGGLMFMLIIWLQGIWLPLHGYSFSQTPLWAGIYMIPLTVGLLAAAPLSGMLADRYGARPFATGGLVLAALTFILLSQLPVNFSYAGFAALIFFNSVGMGMFIAPNQTGHHEQPAGEPARRRSRHGRHLQRLGPGALHRPLLHPHDPGPRRRPCPPRSTTASWRRGSARRWRRRCRTCPRWAASSRRSSGYNPMQVLLGHAELSQLPHSTAAYLTSRQYFPHLIAPAFSKGLTEAFSFAAGACLVGAVASLLRGGKYHHEDDASDASHDDRVPAQEAVAETEVIVGRLTWPSPHATQGSGDVTRRAPDRVRHPHQRCRHTSWRLRPARCGTTRSSVC